MPGPLSSLSFLRAQHISWGGPWTVSISITLERQMLGPCSRFPKRRVLDAWISGRLNEKRKQPFRDSQEHSAAPPPECPPQPLTRGLCPIHVRESSVLPDLRGLSSTGPQSLLPHPLSSLLNLHSLPFYHLLSVNIWTHPHSSPWLPAPHPEQAS